VIAREGVMFRRCATLVVVLFVFGAFAPASVLAAAPRITSFSPQKGPLGTSVTITGHHLAGVTAVRFNGKRATFSDNTAHQVKAVVPKGASSGFIRVTTAGGSDTSDTDFRVTLSLLLAPTIAQPGDTVLVSGAGFSSRGAVDVYFDTTSVALVIATFRGTFTDASFTVPADASAGRHWVTAVDRATSRGRQRAITIQSPLADWPMLQRNPRHHGLNPAEEIISTSNVADLDVLWSGVTQSGCCFNSSPSVADGVVYAGGFDGRLYAFAVGCGTGGSGCDPLWTGATGNNIIFSSPAIADGRVYIGSRDHKLYAFAVGCGTGGAECSPLWTGTTGDQVYSSSPVVVDGVVYVGSIDHYLYAYPADCGTAGGECAPLWRGLTGGEVWSSPAVANDVVYVSSNNGRVYAFAVGCGAGGATCTHIWRGRISPSGTVNQSGPTVSDGVVYVGSGDGSLYAFAVGCATGGGSCSPLWKGNTGNIIYGTPAVARHVVYAGSSDGTLYAFQVGCARGGATCAPLWTGATGGPIGGSSPAVANGVVYIGSQDNRAYAFAVGCGTGGAACSPLWTSDATGDIINAGPAISNGVVYFSSNDNRLYAFSIQGEAVAAAPRPDIAVLRPDPRLRPQW
jgi:outer membrane protein assembly factor BamB